MLVPGRYYNTEKYRFAFQGQEKDDEIKGSTGTSYAYKFRMHDPRIGRFWSIDPLFRTYPYYSPYSFSGNRVIDAVELEGLEPAGYDATSDPLFFARMIKTVSQDIMIGTYNSVTYVNGLVSGPLSVRPVLEKVDRGDGFGEIVKRYEVMGIYELFVGLIDPIATTATVAGIPGVKSLSQPISLFAKTGTASSTGQFIKRNIKNMDKKWIKYQGQINNMGGDVEFHVKKGDVEAFFDGYVDDILKEAKGDYQFLFETGKTTRDKVYSKMTEQFQRQVNVADGNKLEWHFKEEKTMNEFKSYLKEQGVKIPENVSMMHTPAKKG